jgi:NAD(P)-dependent dehydrogenase (short-subunit alcohol dehydrogenase family)
MKPKRALVTGGGGEGCGRAIARRLAKEGAAVVVCDLDELAAHETVRLIVHDGGHAIVRGCDVRIEAEVQEAVAFAARELGGLDVLVNNASAPYRPQAPLEHWADTVATDLLGTLAATRAAIDVMRKTGGAIINMSSTSALAHGRAHGGGSPAYDVAKAGVLRLTTMLGWLGDTENIRVNCLVPDWVATPEVQGYVDGLSDEDKRRMHVPHKLTTLDEIARAVMLLVTDESLSGRVMVWWSSDDAPRLIPFGDRGFERLG